MLYILTKTHMSIFTFILFFDHFKLYAVRVQFLLGDAVFGSVGVGFPGS